MREPEQGDREDQGAGSPTSSDERFQEALDTARRVARRRFGGSWSEAELEDLVSEVMIRYWVAFGEGPGPDSPQGWFTTAISNQATDMHRAHLRRPSIPTGDSVLAENWVDGWLGSVEHNGPGKLTASMHLIHEVLCLISVAGRELITMKYLDRRSTNEIAEATGRTPAAVSQALSRAKRELARALDGNPALLKELRAPMPRAH